MGILKATILNCKLGSTVSHHSGNLSPTLSLRSAKSLGMILSKLKVSLQSLTLHTGKFFFRLLRLEAINHHLPIARLKGRAKHVQSLQRPPKILEIKHDILNKLLKDKETDHVH